MAKNFHSPGEHITFTAAADLVSGQAFLIGLRLAISLTAVASGGSGEAAVEGIWSVPKLSTDAVTQGALLYWDNTNKRLTTTATANTLAGYAAEAAGAGVATVNIKLNA